LLRQYRLHPEKSLGQNFLVDEASLRLVVAAAQISADEEVLEVGAGLGSLTRQLAHSARSVVAVELDTNLIPPLQQVVSTYPNVRVVAGDILTLDPVQLASHAEYIVVANIPYYITSALIRHLLEARIPPQRLVLTVQREVAKRICAGPGDMSLLALSVQVYGHPEIVAHIPASAFYPPPKVDSAVLRIELFSSPLIPAHELDTFFQLIKAGFSQKRKTLRNALSGGLHITPTQVELMLQQADINPMRRAETLDLPEWHHLTSIFRAQFPQYQSGPSSPQPKQSGSQQAQSGTNQ
jgi:16S rRNA (adenine1518-N6/adenine1519-N6)-dimethyltransferase